MGLDLPATTDSDLGYDGRHSLHEFAGRVVRAAAEERERAAGLVPAARNQRLDYRAPAAETTPSRSPSKE